MGKKLTFAIYIYFIHIENSQYGGIIVFIFYSSHLSLLFFNFYSKLAVLYFSVFK